MRTRRKGVKSALAAALCGVTVFAALPADVLAGPISTANLSSMIAPVEKVYYRHYYRHRHYHGGYYPRRYYRGYGYDPGGALFAGAALGLLGAGIAGATQPYYGYGYPGYGYGYGYPGYYGWGW